MKTNTRTEIGIELLRIIAAFMICSGHVNISLYYRVTPDHDLYTSICFIEMLTLYGVNLFGLITGYVCISSKFTTKRILRIYGDTLFYSIIGLILTYFVFPNELSKDLIFQSIFPVSKGAYWYVTAYAGTFLVSPAINTFITRISIKQVSMLLTFLIIIVIYSFFVNDIFKFGWGYCASWLICLYCFGGAFRRLKDSGWLIQKRHYNIMLILIYFLSVIFNWILKISEAGINIYISDRIQRYDNILILSGSVALFLLFSNIKINSKIWIKIIFFFSSASFAIYLIQVNPLFWNKIIDKKYLYLAENGKQQYFIHLLIHSAVSFLVFTIIDTFKRSAFSGLNIDLAIVKISNKIDEFF